MIWQHSHEELCSFIDALNSFHETIKFTAEISDISVNFLDVTITKDKEGNLSTDLYTKPTDSHLYLHYSSYHPKHQKDSLPYSQALRLRRICSTDNLYKTASENLLQNFKYRGYPTQLVRSAINKAFSRNRDDLLQPKKPISTQKSIIPFITSNNTLNPPIRKILSKYTRILETSEDLKSVLDNKIMVVYKRATNIKQMLVRADITPQDINKGSSPCGKPCIICPFMAKTEQITSWKTKEQFRIKGRFNCKTKNVIYVISCKKCGLQYVGQSGNTFNERLRGHFMDIKQKNDVKPVSRHFILNDHTQNDVTATIVAQTTNDVNVRLRTEEVWIAKLQTKHPTGLNLIQ